MKVTFGIAVMVLFGLLITVYGASAGIPESELPIVTEEPEIKPSHTTQNAYQIPSIYMPYPFGNWPQVNRVEEIAVSGVFTASVVQQPQGNNLFVSQDPDAVTQFSSPAKDGIFGLLAHNNLLGELFYQIQIGQTVRITLSDGSNHYYEIVRIEQYQKLSPGSTSSRYVQLATNKKMTTGQVYSRFYDGSHKVVFQTCLKKEGSWVWGLTFWTAIHMEEVKEPIVQ